MERVDQVVALDASVIFTDPMWALFDVVGADAGRSAHAIAAIFHYEFAVDLWSGHVTEERFWSQFTQRVGVLTTSPRWRSTVLDATQPQPAFRTLPALTERCEIWLVANHRHEWLSPALHASGAVRYLDRKVISSRTGLMQPQPAAYQHLRRLTNGRPVLFVGDSAAHAAGARAAGMDAVVADAAGNWEQTVQKWHESSPRRPAALGTGR
jgi:FMN phosphatase YigB (HAD superfamily)